MDVLCDSQFWDEDLIRNTDDPDLTLCFENTVLIWTPCVFLGLFSFLEIHYFIHSKRRNIPYTWKFYLRFLLTSFLILLSFVDLVTAIYDSFYKKVYSVSFITPCIKIITFIGALVLLFYNRKYGMRTSGLLFVFWFLLALCGAFQFRSLLRHQDDSIKQSYTFISYMIYYPVVLASFFANFLLDDEPTLSDYPKTDKPCPEQDASYLSRILFTWFDALAYKGFKKPLETTDLWSLSFENAASNIVPKFDKYWNEAWNRFNKSQTLDKPSGQLSGQVDLKNSKKKKIVSILIPICKAFGPTFLFGASLQLIQDIILFVSPQLLKLLIEFVNGSEPRWKGFFYCFLFLSSGIIRMLLQAQYSKRMHLVGMRIRTALVAAIYRKSLTMSNAAKKNSTVGEIVNLMSVDAQRFMDLTPYFNIIWSAPFQIILALYFLWDELGVSLVAGLVVMIALIPINGFIATKLQTLQTQQMKNKDERVKLINEVLNGIKVLKLYAWESSFEEQIMQIRDKEIKVLKKEAHLNAGINFLWTCAPFLVSLASFGTYVYIDDTHILNSTKAFVSISLFNIIQLPLTMLPMMIAYLVQTAVSVKRINTFMNADDLDPDNVQHNQAELNPLIIRNGSFSWDVTTSTSPTLKNIDLEVEHGKLVAVVGTVGSGKSSLISAFLGEIDRVSGRVNTKGSIALVSQQAWIQNATVQENILFGKTLNKEFYNRVVDACALTPDLKMLPAGDQTEIGERGINLSGGQKQRVALARAVYSNTDVYLLDDPLSAVDSHVGKHIFENVIGPNGLLSKKTRVLVTHAITYLSEVDNIVVLKDGEISEMGTYQVLMEKRGAFSDFLTHHSQDVVPGTDSELKPTDVDSRRESSIGNDVQRKLSRELSTLSEAHNEFRSTQIGEKIIEIEKAETGRVKFAVYAHYFKSIGWFISISIIFMNFIFQLFNTASNLWISKWSDDNTTVIDNITDASKRDTYVGVYGALGLGQGIMIFGISIVLARGSVRASRMLFLQMLSNILRNPMSFFDSTPCGRLLNRFSKEIDVVDNVLPQYIRAWLACLLAVISILIVISISTPMFGFVIIPIGVVYYFIQRFYIPTSGQLKRLESVSRSPIYSHFGESIGGAQIIRAYGEQHRFLRESEYRVDSNQLCYYPSIIANIWLGIRLEMLSNMVVFFSALFAVLERATSSGGLIGLSVSFALQMTQTLNWLVECTSEVETNIVAVERIKEYSDTPQEAPWEIENTTPEKDWPLEGQVEFQDFKVRYREGLELVLNGLTFTVNSGEKVGIVGRTGAGKSSLTLSLFRIIEAAEGKILIDGIDISKLGLHALRSRLTIIPQDPVLFSGNVRINLDPFNVHEDSAIWQALEHAHLKSFVQGLQDGLSHLISEGGDNLSVGQRQLICLARALLRKTSILILDEATAAVDLETDELIQRTIRQEFKECTILTIAHRLNTILDSDRVIVLDKGNITEFDSPNTLLERPSSTFYSMAKDAGLVA